MVYAHVFAAVRFYARAESAIAARRVFVRMIRAMLLAEAEKLAEAKDMLSAHMRMNQAHALRIGTDTVFEYCANHQTPECVGAHTVYDASVKQIADRPEAYAKLRAYQKPSRYDWAHNAKQSLAISRRNIYAHEYDAAEIEVVTLT